MKKKLFDLSVEEFTRLLLDYPEEHDFTIVADDGEKIDCKGTYSEVLDVVMFIPTLREQLESKFFDYDMQLEDIDVYNYLEYKTDKFNVKKGGLVESQMCFIHDLYLEEVDEQARLEYIRNGWEVPKEQCKDVSANTMIEADDTKQMRERCFPCRDYQYQFAMAILKRELDNKEQNINVAPVEPQQMELKDLLPEKLKADEAVGVFQNAIDVQLITNSPEGLKWNDTKQLLAYFATKVSDKFNLTTKLDKDGNKTTDWKTFETLFEQKGLKGAKQNWMRINTKFKPTGFEKVDVLF